MRRQNPPQESLDQALALERYLNPAPLGEIYTVCATAGFVVITLLFAVLASGYFLSPTKSTTTLFVLLALSPGVLALVEFISSPNDLLSFLIRRLANSRRRPIRLTADSCTFKVPLKTGETMSVNLSFHYPAKKYVAGVEEFLLDRVRCSLDHDSSMRTRLPSEKEVRDTVDDALDTVASEFNIPVLYSEVRDLHRIRDAYSTGTLG
ncbi:MAG: hypothetical protein WAM66_03215 [Acidobacteriaceae bacterium]